MLNLAISGITGRMGQACIEAASENDKTNVTLGTVPKDTQILSPTGIEITDDLLNSKIPFDVLIDFSTPDATLAHTKACSQHNKPIVIGTTGFTPNQWQELQASTKNIPVLYSANMSIGVHVMSVLLAQAGKMLAQDNIATDIIETHHQYKKDAPSGTALQLAAVLEKAMQTAPNPPQSIRAGNIVGEHEVRFGMPYERLTIKHEAFDRKIFAQGAIKAALWLKNQPAGWYGLADIFS